MSFVNAAIAVPHTCAFYANGNILINHNKTKKKIISVNFATFFSFWRFCHSTLIYRKPNLCSRTYLNFVQISCTRTEFFYKWGVRQKSSTMHTLKPSYPTPADSVHPVITRFGRDLESVKTACL